MSSLIKSLLTLYLYRTQQKLLHVIIICAAFTRCNANALRHVHNYYIFCATEILVIKLLFLSLLIFALKRTPMNGVIIIKNICIIEVIKLLLLFLFLLLLLLLKKLLFTPVYRFLSAEF